MARHVLGGPAEDGRAGYQIALTVCPTCHSGQQQTGGELVTVDADVIAMAACAAQHVGRISPLPANENAHVGSGQTEEGPTTSATTFTGAAHGGARAKQTVPPALRRTVLRRDQHRCRAPGCRNARFVDVHHIELRSEGGRNELANLITMCGAHHRATHRGQLVIENDAHGGVRFRHADGTGYGQALQPKALDTQAKLFSALRGLGFREHEVRAVLAELRQDEKLRGAGIDQLLREGLRRIPLPSAGAARRR